MRIGFAAGLIFPKPRVLYPRETGDYMPFLITWTTHNSWLPGDPRGFRTFRGEKYVPPPARYADSETDSYDREKFDGLYNYNLREEGVKLNNHERRIVADVVLNTIREFCLGRAVLCVGTTHTHLLVELERQITVPQFCRYAKGRSARKLIDVGHKGKIWARGYHVRYVDAADWDAVRQYVLSHKTCEVIIREMS
jgi:REP element-mobilizing transposase RayT